MGCDKDKNSKRVGIEKFSSAPLRAESSCKGLNAVEVEYVQLSGSVAPSSQPNRCDFCDARTSSLAGFTSSARRRHTAYVACSIGAHALPWKQMRGENSGANGTT